MITENELTLRNESYINKDFDSVYRELISLAKKISDRYDPTTSNESDPFIVLVKLLAFATDKINYNVDKNLLERFLLSATQEESVADITSRLGYPMHYYIAAETDVTFTYNGDIFDTNNAPSSIEIPKNLILGTRSEGIKYITTESFRITSDSRSASVKAIECSGSLKTLTVISDTSGTTGNTTITVSNLDKNNRIYFPESMVAQNGVFIHGGVSMSEMPEYYDDKSTWHSVDNLNSAHYGSLSYCFAYDSFLKLPYIEFPEWISNIIGSGLEIQYITCTGSAGNIKAKGINSIQGGIPSISNNITLNSEDFIVTNTNAAVNGSDPETIDEAYQGFKKTIGTFDTLVTCRDYANRIYNLLSASGNNYVSNVQVSDRRNDINYSRNVISYSAYGIQTKSISGDDSIDLKANDLCVYPLNPISNLSFEKLNESDGYDNTYTRVLDTYPIRQELEDEKYICHDFAELATKDIILIKNLYSLNVAIYTTYKVTEAEALNILLNVNTALAENFNSRKVDFGYEIPEDIIHSVILKSDSRIKSVSLNIPKQEIIALLKGDTDDEDVSLTNSTLSPDWYKFITAQNVLSGRAQLFEYNGAFVYDYGQSTNTILEDIKSISTYPFGVTVSNSDGNTTYTPNERTLTFDSSAQAYTYTLRANEVIQLSTPSIKEDGVIYGFPIKYLFSGTGFNVGNSLDAGIYSLKGDQQLTFKYTKNDVVQTDTYKAGDIISLNNSLTIKASEDYIPQGTEISIRDINSVTLNKSILCYWYTNAVNNEIRFKHRGQGSIYWDYVLNDNEYFFYTDNKGSFLSSCGSGTKLTLADHNYTMDESESSVWSEWTINKSSQISYVKILSDGLESVIDKFIPKLFNSSSPDNEAFHLDLLEQNIVTLTEGDIIRVSNSSGAPELPPNYFENIDKNNIIKYRFSDSEAAESSYNTLENIDVSINGHDLSRGWRALLDVSSGPESGQTLTLDTDGNYKQAVLLKTTDNSVTLLKSDYVDHKISFLFNILRQFSGGENIDLEYATLTTDTNYPSLYYYNISNPKITKLEGETVVPDIVFEKQSNDYYQIFGKHGAENINPDGSIEFTIPLLDGDIDTYLMFYLSSSINYIEPNESDPNPDQDKRSYVDITFSPKSGSGYVYLFGKFDTSGNPVSFGTNGRLKSNQTYIFKLTNIEKIKITKEPQTVEGIIQDDDRYITLSMPKLVVGLNPLLNLKFEYDPGETHNRQTDLSKFIKYMHDNLRLSRQLDVFYPIHNSDSDRLIELSNDYKLDSPQAFCDYNNVANQWTLAKINFQNSDIRIASTSLKR